MEPRMDDQVMLEELAKIRLRLIRQRIDKEKKEVPWTQSGPAGSSIGMELLKTEILRGKQLERQIEEEREKIYRNKRQSTPNENVKEILPLLMAQNVQMQQVVMQQMMKNLASENSTSTKPLASRFPSHSVQNVQSITHREMTPLRGLPFTTYSRKAQDSKQVSTRERVRSRRRSDQAQRGLSSPVRATDRVSFINQRVTPRGEGFLDVSNREATASTYPFPGTTGIRKLRHVFYIVWFCVSLLFLLKRINMRRLEAVKKLHDMIEGAITELHQSYYLNSEGPILEQLQRAFRDDKEGFMVKTPGMFQRLTAESKAVIDELAGIVETVVNAIAGINPTSGLLSPTEEGVMWRMMQPGTIYPRDYLWHVEKVVLPIDDRGAISTIESLDAILLILGLFVSRGLVSTLLLDPVNCGLSEGTPSLPAYSNLKVLASVFMRIVRDLSSPQKGKPLPQAAEINSLLYTDEEMKYLFKKLDSCITNSKNQLKRWVENFYESIEGS